MTTTHCIFNCGKSISENDMEKHIKYKCINKLKFMHCNRTDTVYSITSNDLSSHIKLCHECKMKKADISIITSNPQLGLKSKKSNVNHNKDKGQSGQYIRKANNPCDDTMLNIQLSKKKAYCGRDINNTMIMSDNKKNSSKEGDDNEDEEDKKDDSFAFYGNELNYKDNVNRKHNGNDIIREYEEDEDDYEKNEDEFNEYFVNAEKPKDKDKVKIKDKEHPKEKEDKKKESSSSDSEDYNAYFI